METLKYRSGREMKWEPTNTNEEALLDALKRTCEPAVVVLEPGDATRYHLMIVPLTTLTGPHLGTFGIGYVNWREYIFVAHLRDDVSKGGWLRWTDYIEFGEYDIGFVDNPWSKTFIAWWLNGLRERFFDS